MKRLIYIIVILLYTNGCLLFSQKGAALNHTNLQITQSNLSEAETKSLERAIYEKQLHLEAKKKNIPAQDLRGFISGGLAIFDSKQNSHIHPQHAPNDPYGVFTVSKPSGGGGGYIQSSACSNASFENGNFAGWTGSWGLTSTGPGNAPTPNYAATAPIIVSTAGANTSLVNPTNYHTIMNIPPTNNLYPNCGQFGYDSIAVKAVGNQTLSQIPYVCPFYNDGNSVRLNCAIAFNRAAKLKYNFNIGPANRNVTYAFAVVLYDGGHNANEQPFFQVKVTDQNNNPIGGNCGTYVINSTMAGNDTSFALSALSNFGNVYYRKWRHYGIDLTGPAFAAVTQVNVEFTAGGCAQGGHYAYAYVDAECSQGGVTNAMCAGTNTAQITAPNGYVSYQWFGPNSNTPYPNSMGGNTQTININPAIVGDTYTVNMVTPTGCTVQLSNTLSISSVSITGVSSLPTCPGGTSGKAIVQVAGSNVGYSYQWQNSGGTTISTSSVASNLAPGVYSITVSGVSCGAATQTVQVGIASPLYISMNAPFCGNKAIISNLGQTNYQWYNNLTPIAPPIGTAPTLTINSPVNNSIYYLTYNTPQGCKDSIKYQLVSTPPGAVYVGSVTPICTGGNNGSAAIIISPANGAPTGLNSYSITGPGAYSASLAPTANNTFVTTGLSAGIYTIDAFDGSCFYNQSFTITPFTFNYTVTPLTSTVCQGASVTASLVFGNQVVGNPCSNVGVGPACPNPNIIQVGTQTGQNTSFSYPAIYGNFYRNSRHQLLFTASELTNMGISQGYISSIAFNIITVTGTTNYPNFTIKLKCTNVNSLPTTAFDNTGLTQVFTAANYVIAAGWNTHTFQTPYYWDGVSNLLVDVCNSQTPNFTQNSVSPYTTTAFNSCLYWYSDPTPACMTTQAPFTWSGTTNRPLARFGNCAGTNPSQFTYSWTPSSFLSATNQTTTIITPTTNPGSLTSITYSTVVTPNFVNCPVTQTFVVTVYDPQSPTITPIVDLCNTSTPITISVTPTGGTFSSGVSPSLINPNTGVITPSLAAIGTNTFMYSVGSGTCGANNIGSFNVSQFNTASITGSISNLCVNSALVNLNSIVQSTVNGIWSGSGVVGTYSFDPTGLATNIYTLTYNTSSSPNLTVCPDTKTISVSVLNPTPPLISLVGPLCNISQNVQLTVTPTTGTWTSNSYLSSTGVFNPSLASIGNNTVQYIVGTSTCNVQDTKTISVEAYIPAVITGNIVDKCNTSPPVGLTQLASTNFGTWSGPGVAANTFNPGTSGTGNIVITYNTASIPSGLCPSQATLAVNVYSLATPVITKVETLCNSAAPFLLQVSPLGGVFSGANNSAVTPLGQFYPPYAIIGNNFVNYSVTSGPCIAVAQATINIEKFVSADLSQYAGPFCKNDAGLNLNSIVQNVGGLWTGPGVNNNIFIPANANIGNNNLLIYSTHSLPTASLCPDTSAIRLQVNDIPVVSIVSSKKEGCSPVEIVFNSPTVNSGKGLWNFGDDSDNQTGLTLTHIYTKPGVYNVSFNYIDDIGCSGNATLPDFIKIYETPKASFSYSPTEISIANPDVQFSNLSTVLGDNTYQWQVGNFYQTSEVSPVVTFPKIGDYEITLTATTINGCKDVTNKIIQVKNEFGIYIPNVFTPNGDNLNDVFVPIFSPYGFDLKTFNMEVFDRWGELVFSTKDALQGWDGTRKNKNSESLKEDVYVYKIKFKDSDGKIYNKTGHVTLMK